MSTDPVKLGYLFAEIVSGHDVSRFDEIVAPGYVNHNAFAEPGPEGGKRTFQGRPCNATVASNQEGSGLQ